MLKMARLIDADKIEWILSAIRSRESGVPLAVAEWVTGIVINAPTVAAVDVKQYEELREKYNELRENFVDYVCSGTSNLAPYCINKCKECVDGRGWCKPNSEKCTGFNPAYFLV